MKHLAIILLSVAVAFLVIAEIENEAIIRLQRQEVRTLMEQRFWALHPGPIRPSDGGDI